MNPYRAQELRRPTLELASDRARLAKLIGGSLVIAASFAVFLACAASGLGVVFVGPFVLGALLISQARSGAIVLFPEERVGEVVLRGPLRRLRTRFAYADVVGSAVERALFAGKPADWALALTLTNKRRILLLRGGAGEIEPALAKLDAFLADHDLARRKSVS